MTSPDVHSLAAQYRHGLPLDWEWRQVTCLSGGFIELRGASPVGTFQRGPRKGRPKFPPRSQYQRAIITDQDVADARARWEAESGHCSYCGGTGQEVMIGDGTGCRTCRACGGTGKPKQ